MPRSHHVFAPAFAPLAIAFAAACSSSSATPSAPSPDSGVDTSVDVVAPDSPDETPPSASCGVCPAGAPLCYRVNAHDGSHIVAATCIALPASCAATPTCECASAAIRASWTSDAGADSGLPGCPGNGALYCDGSAGSLTIRCNPS